MKTFAEYYRGENRSKSDQIGFYSLKNCDVHSDLGIVRPNYGFSAESTTPNEDCISETLTNGDIFFFSTESGKIWKRTSAGVYSLVHTNTNGANLGCALWQGYLYYATSTKLGRITEALASSQATWSSQADTWQTFSKTTSYRPMVIVEDVLYIGNGNFVAYVDWVHAFEDEGLDLPSMYTVTALGELPDELLVGTTRGTGHCKIFLWNNLSTSWTFADTIPETSVNCFIKADNISLFQCGANGNMYYWSGSQAVKFKKIRATTSINPYNSTEFQGRPMIAIGKSVYSIYREGGEFPYAIVKEYTTEEDIKSIISTSTKLFASTGKVYSIGESYADMEIETPVMDGQASDVEVIYRTIAEGATVKIFVSVDGGAYDEKTAVVDTVNKRIFFNGGIGKTNEVQVKIVTSGYCELKAINVM